MRQHNALALAGGSGGKNEQGHCIGIYGCAVVRIAIGFQNDGASLLQQSGNTGHAVLCSHENGICYKLTGIGDRGCLFCSRFVNAQKAYLCLRCGICEIGCIPFRIQRHQNCADGKQGVVQQRPIVGHAADNCTVLACAAHCGKLDCQCTDVVAHLCKGNGNDFFIVRIAPEGEQIFFFSVGDGSPFNEVAYAKKFFLFVKEMFFHDSYGFCRSKSILSLRHLSVFMAHGILMERGAVICGTHR